jgi:hypothetical protein
MKMSGRYSPGLYAGVTGILALVAINAFSIPSSLQQADVRSRITAEAQLEQTKPKPPRRLLRPTPKRDRLFRPAHYRWLHPKQSAAVTQLEVNRPVQKTSSSTNPANVPVTHYRENSTSPNTTKEFVTMSKFSGNTTPPPVGDEALNENSSSPKKATISTTLSAESSLWL